MPIQKTVRAAQPSPSRSSAAAKLARDVSAEQRALTGIQSRAQKISDQFIATSSQADLASVMSMADQLVALGKEGVATKARSDALVAQDRLALAATPRSAPVRAPVSRPVVAPQAHATRAARQVAKASAAAPHAGPWRGGPGFGISMKDTGNTKGNGVFIGYAGFNVSMQQAQSWVQHLYTSDLKRLGVRYIYAVQGPADPSYNGGEIGNSQLAARLVTQAPKAKFVLVAGHSSGSFVADELLHQLANGADPRGTTKGKVVFFNLDGGQKYDGSGINRTRKTYYVSAHDHRTGTVSPNWDAMRALGGQYKAKGGFFEYDATRAGSAPGAAWSLHTSLITSRPHSRFTGSPVDYGDFSGGRSANHAWLDARLKDAKL